MIKQGDFVEIDYIAKIKDTEIVFDLTYEKKARELNLFNPNMKYGPVVICVGEKNLISGLDDGLIGKDIGNFDLDIASKNAFGSKNPKLLKIIKTDMFLKEKINPFVGLQVNVDGMIGVIRSVSGGRTIVDFNHPLSGRDVAYHVEIKRIVTDDIEKTKSLITFNLFLDESKYRISKAQDIIQVKTKVEIPKEIIEVFVAKYAKLVSNTRNISFLVDKGDTTTQK